jgi:hypothetical protein
MEGFKEMKHNGSNHDETLDTNHSDLDPISIFRKNPIIGIWTLRTIFVPTFDGVPLQSSIQCRGTSRFGGNTE